MDNNLNKASQPQGANAVPNGAYYGEQAAKTCDVRGTAYRPPTMAEQAEKNADYHAEQHGKHRAAANFLVQHPEFDQFIQLVRSGAIQF
jgi:hypothetical protein